MLSHTNTSYTYSTVHTRAQSGEICKGVIKQTQYLLKDVLRKEQKRLFLKGKETYEGNILGKLPLNMEAPAVVRTNVKFVHLTVSRVQI